MSDQSCHEIVRLSFGGHETFPFRFGWLRKGFNASATQGTVLSSDEAVVKLGVGKNMVRSIRTWCLATQVLEEVPSPTGRARALKPTEIGQLVFSEEGDPYLEEPGSLWLLHWLLLTNPDRLSLWRIAFMECSDSEFTKASLVDLAVSFASARQQSVDLGSVERDVDVFVRTYVRGRSSNEEGFACPLADLGLVSTGSAGDRYAFSVGPKRSLPEEVLGFALLEFLSARGGSSCSLSDATYLPGSPGQAFKLDEESVVSTMRGLADRYREDWLVDVDGPLRRIGIRRHVDGLGLLQSLFRRVAR